MQIIPDKDREYIRQMFAEDLTEAVEIEMYTDPPGLIVVPGRERCETCEDTQRLMEEVSDLSENLTLLIHNVATDPDAAAAAGVERVPAIVLKGKARGSVRFFGIPSGYEFSAFLADLVDTARGTTDLAGETRDVLDGLREDVHIKVFATPT